MPHADAGDTDRSSRGKRLHVCTPCITGGALGLGTEWRRTGSQPHANARILKEGGCDLRAALGFVVPGGQPCRDCAVFLVRSWYCYHSNCRYSTMPISEMSW